MDGMTNQFIYWSHWTVAGRKWNVNCLHIYIILKLYNKTDFFLIEGPPWTLPQTCNRKRLLIFFSPQCEYYFVLKMHMYIWWFYTLLMVVSYFNNIGLSIGFSKVPFSFHNKKKSLFTRSDDIVSQRMFFVQGLRKAISITVEFLIHFTMRCSVD